MRSKHGFWVPFWLDVRGGQIALQLYRILDRCFLVMTWSVEVMSSMLTGMIKTLNKFAVSFLN